MFNKISRLLSRGRQIQDESVKLKLNTTNLEVIEQKEESGNSGRRGTTPRSPAAALRYD